MHQRHVLAPLGCTVEGIANNPLHAKGGVQAFLGRHFLGSVSTQHTPGPDVRALRALTAHDEVDRLSTRKWPLDAGIQLDRPEVHVVIHHETQGQQNTTLEDSGRNGGVAYGPKQDGITGSQFLDNSIREQLSGGVVSGCTQVIVRGRDVDPRLRGDGVEDLDRFGNHLGADAVAGNQSKIQISGHGRRAY